MGAGEIGRRLCTLSSALGLDVTCVRRRPEAGLPPGVLNVVVGGAEAGHALAAHGSVGKISFTG